jgi:hypothetical protein
VGGGQKGKKRKKAGEKRDRKITFEIGNEYTNETNRGNGMEQRVLMFWKTTEDEEKKRENKVENKCGSQS